MIFCACEPDTPDSLYSSRGVFTIPGKTLNEFKQAKCLTGDVPETANISPNVVGNGSLISWSGLCSGYASSWRRCELRVEFVRRLFLDRFRGRSGCGRMSQRRSHAQVVESPLEFLVLLVLLW